jgi:hypothetical protein
MASIHNDTQAPSAISWSLITQATAADPSFPHLLQQIEHGNKVINCTDPSLAPFWPIHKSIYEDDDVLLYQDRVIVPSSLHPQVLQNLHTAHQGTSAMEQHARQIVYWPGMSKDIKATREGCAECNFNAPSQAATPPFPQKYCEDLPL